MLLEERTATGALSTRENIYEKLGVHTRTAAVAHLRGSA